MRQALPDLEGQGFFELLDGVYASGEPFVGSELLARFDRNDDGVVEDGYFNFVYHPLRDADVEVRGIMIHAVEVTDQVVARKEVELKAEELLRLTHALEQSNRDLTSSPTWRPTISRPPCAASPTSRSGSRKTWATG